MQDWEAKKAMKAAVAKALQSANPHLVAVSGEKGCDGLNAAAKNIRIELKRAFPAVKFAVKSSRYSGGDSISVRWTDGPQSEQVDAIIGKYAAGSFSGMDDSYTYSDSRWNDAFGDAKYISATRDYSDKAIDSAIRYVWARYGFNGAAKPAVADFRAGRCWGVRDDGGSYDDLQSLIYRAAARQTWALASKAARVAVSINEKEAA